MAGQRDDIEMKTLLIKHDKELDKEREAFKSWAVKRNKELDLNVSVDDDDIVERCVYSGGPYRTFKSTRSGFFKSLRKMIRKCF